VTCAAPDVLPSQTASDNSTIEYLPLSVTVLSISVGVVEKGTPSDHRPVNGGVP
jgi:hypothetical protein